MVSEKPANENDKARDAGRDIGRQIGVALHMAGIVGGWLFLLALLFGRV